MAHSACWLVLIVLCLSQLLLHPTMADKNPSPSTKAPHRRHLHHHRHRGLAPAPSDVLKKEGNPLLKQLCDDKKYSDLCSKIFKEDDKENWSKLKDVKKPEISIDFAIALATKSSEYMGKELNSTHLEESVASDVEVCLRHYKDMIDDLQSASQELKENPGTAKDYLKDADYKAGFCKASKVPPILQINGILLRLVNGASLHIKDSDDSQPIFNFK